MNDIHVNDILLFKIVIVGKFSSGKTSLLRRYVFDKFSKSYKSTIGLDLFKKSIRCDDSMITLQVSFDAKFHFEMGFEDFSCSYGTHQGRKNSRKSITCITEVRMGAF